MEKKPEMFDKEMYAAAIALCCLSGTRDESFNSSTVETSAISKVKSNLPDVGRSLTEKLPPYRDTNSAFSVLLNFNTSGSSAGKRFTENEVPLSGCKNGTEHVSLNSKGFLMNNDIIQDEISNIQEYEEELNDEFRAHSIACIGSIPEKDNVSLECSHCVKTYRSKQSYQKHIRLIHGKRNHKCLNCNKTFYLSADLKIHIRTHTGERPYKCSLCEKTFTKKMNLSRHFRTHTGKRPFKCSLCEKKFSRRWDMSQHIRTHTGERPFKCSLCEKAFTSRCIMSQHIRTHTGERPFKCSLCQKAFTSRWYMSQHIRIHTGERPFKCSLCEKAFASRWFMSQHIRKHRTNL